MQKVSNYVKLSGHEPHEQPCKPAFSIQPYFSHDLVVLPSLLVDLVHMYSTCAIGWLWPLPYTDIGENNKLDSPAGTHDNG